MNLRDKIWEWAEGLDDWQNDLLSRVYEKGQLEESDLKEVHGNLRASLLNLDYPHEPIRLRKEQIQATIGNEEPIQVIKLQNVKNVGSVTEDGELSFLPEGLTVIYGENGAGKSSYARVLKKACRAIKQDLEIHPNAFQERGEEGSAEIVIHKDGSEEGVERKVNDPPHPDLNSISIYDRECAEAYTEGNEMDIPYMPSSLQALKQMADEQKRIRELVESEKDSVSELLEKLLVELVEFPQDDLIHPIISELSAETDIQELGQLKGLSEEEAEKLNELEEAYEASDPGKINKKISGLTSKKGDTKKLVSRLDEIDEKINKRLDKTFPELIEEINRLKEAQAILREEFDQDLDGTGNEAWKTLWEAAKHFSVNHAYKGEDYPVIQKKREPAKCVLCQQALNEDGVAERYKRFDEFIEDDIERQLKQQRQVRDNYVIEIEELQLTDLISEQVRNTLNNVDEQLTRQLDEIVSVVNSTKDEITEALEEEKWEADIEPISVSVEDQLRELVDGYLQQIESYNELKDSEKRAELEEKINQLLAKKELEEKFETIRKIVNRKNKCQLLDATNRALNSKPISDKVSDFGQEIVEEIRDQLSNNLSIFGLSHLSLEVEKRGRLGETKSEMILENKQQLAAKDILSEGEKNAVSLSYFLAEISHADHNGTLIFDDPVSSLDHKHRESVAKKIVDTVASNNQQSIVFTHDIVFLLELEQKVSDKIPFKIIYLTSDDDISGRVVDEDNGRPWTGMKVNHRIIYLNKRLNEIRRMKNNDAVSDNTIKLTIVGWYGRLRESWERAVEELMLGDVVNRYRTGVATKNLHRVKITEDYISEVDQQMTYCSNQAHDQAPERNNPLPNFDDMQDDVKKLKVFRKEIIKS
jgi:energy-coupling factor transporter ATP-binding protein EcfA2